MPCSFPIIPNISSFEESLWELTKNDSENWNRRDDKRGWMIFQPHFFNLNGIAYHHLR